MLTVLGEHLKKRSADLHDSILFTMMMNCRRRMRLGIHGGGAEIVGLFDNRAPPVHAVGLPMAGFDVLLLDDLDRAGHDAASLFLKRIWSRWEVKQQRGRGCLSWKSTCSGDPPVLTNKSSISDDVEKTVHVIGVRLGHQNIGLFSKDIPLCQYASGAADDISVSVAESSCDQTRCWTL